MSLRVDRQFGRVREFVNDETGQDLIEYSLLLSFISFCVLAVVMQVQQNLQAFWTAITDTLDDVIGAVS